MLLAFVALLILPAFPPQPTFAQLADANAQPVVTVAAVTDTTDVKAAVETAAQPAAAAANADALPDAPTPLNPAFITETPGSKPNPLKNSTVSVTELKAEARHNQHVWMALGLAEHSAAVFDGWTTRHSITVDGAHEADPLMKPFAGNDSIYAALQAGPFLMDYLGKKMMYSRHSWMRRVWWLPQTASIADSVLCGAHNLSVRPAN